MLAVLLLLDPSPSQKCRRRRGDVIKEDGKKVKREDRVETWEVRQADRRGWKLELGGYRKE